MSGPVDPRDTAVTAAAGAAPTEGVEVREGRRTSLPGVNIVRVLPTKGRRTIGPWCFVDCILPSDAEDPDPMEIGPHPHIGLSTVTWLLAGEAVHTDSLGTEQPIRPGQLNLMTAGHGIAHAELGLAPGIRGIQMWVAQPEDTRHGASQFQHVEALPTVDIPDGQATVFMGRLGDVISPARRDSPLVGVELRTGRSPIELPADPAFEYAVVPLEAPVKVGEAIVEPDYLGYVPPGAEVLRIDPGGGGGRVMVVGGEPFERVVMWWNFVARSTEEITRAWSDWQAHDTDRFAGVTSKLARIDAPRPPWVRAAST